MLSRCHLFGSWLELIFFSACPLSPYYIGPRLLYLAGAMCFIAGSDAHLQTKDWWMVREEVRLFLPVVRSDKEADDNEVSAELGLALLCSLIGESQLRILKIQPQIIFSNMVYS